MSVMRLRARSFAPSTTTTSHWLAGAGQPQPPGRGLQQPDEGDVIDFSCIIRGCWNAEASVAIADSPAE